jgi:hypothetical protein
MRNAKVDLANFGDWVKGIITQALTIGREAKNNHLRDVKQLTDKALDDLLGNCLAQFRRYQRDREPRLRTAEPSVKNLIGHRETEEYPKSCQTDLLPETLILCCSLPSKIINSKRIYETLAP